MLFFVAGVPVPQGSMKGFVVGNRAVLTSDNPNLKAWRKAVADATPELLFVGAVSVDLVFILPRPKTVKRALPSVKPDIDKLSRAILDGMTGAAFADDSQVVVLSASKRYAVEGETTGVIVTVDEVAHV